MLLVGYQPEAKPRADILPVTPETKAKGLLSAIEPSNEVYIQFVAQVAPRSKAPTTV